MKPAERDIEKHLSDHVKALGGLSLKLTTLHTTGLPDRLCLLPGGRCLFVELKAPGKKPRKIQTYMHHKLRGLGFKVLIIDSKEGVKDVK